MGNLYGMQMGPLSMQPMSAQKKCMKRLRNLMKEYNDLEDREEKLLGMLDHVRQEERSLVRALHDEIETNNELIDRDEPSATNGATPAQKILDKEPNDNEQQPEKSLPEENTVQSNEEQDIQEEQPEHQVETTEATASADDNIADATTRPTKRYKRGRARAVMDKQAEAKKRGQEMEEQRLARQRLENALFADDDDEDDDSSSTSS